MSDTPENAPPDGYEAELAALRRLVEAHEWRLSPVDEFDLPVPTRHFKSRRDDHSMDGPRWNVGDWQIGAFDDPESQECVHIRTPLEMQTGDVEVLRLDDARRFAAALLAAINYSTNELAARRRRRQAS